MFKSYEDAMHDIRVDLYLDSLKPRKQESDETPESITRTAGNYIRVILVSMNQPNPKYLITNSFFFSLDLLL